MCLPKRLHVNESVCIKAVTVVRKTNGHVRQKPLYFSHAPAAGEKQPLLTLRSKLQILSMLRIRSLCGEQIKKVQLTLREICF